MSTNDTYLPWAMELFNIYNRIDIYFGWLDHYLPFDPLMPPPLIPVVDTIATNINLIDTIDVADPPLPAPAATELAFDSL